MEAVHKLRIESPYEILEIEDIKINCRPNEHGYLYLKCLIDDSINEKYSVEASTNDKIRIYEETDDKEADTTIFAGIVQSVETVHVNGVYYLELEALTYSCKMDIEEKSRSFQDKNMIYDNLLGEIFKSYSGYWYTECMDRPYSLNKPLFQYKETDFQFIKRIASNLGIDIHCDMMDNANMFYFGRPKKDEFIFDDNLPYKAHKDIDAYNKSVAERGFPYASIEYFYYEIKTNIVVEIGAKIWFKNVEFYIYSYEAEYINGELLYTYRLCRKSAIWQRKIYNKKLKGISLQGKVLEVDGEQLKLHLDIDEEQDQGKAYWFRYAPPTGNLMYSMPIVGTNAELYFPNECNDDPIVIGCVRTNGSSCEKFSDTSNRYFATESDNNLDLLPNAVNLSRPGMSINMHDSGGVTLNSSSSMYVGAPGISLDADKISIKADERFEATKDGESMVSLENDFYNEASSKVYENGSCRETFNEFTDDEPTAHVIEARAQMAANSGNLIASLNGSNPMVGQCMEGTAEENKEDSANKDGAIESFKNLNNRINEVSNEAKNDDVEVFEQTQKYENGQRVKKVSYDGTIVYGTAYDSTDIEDGKQSSFIPDDQKEYNEHNSELKHAQSEFMAILDTAQQAFWDAAEFFSYANDDDSLKSEDQINAEDQYHEALSNSARAAAYDTHTYIRNKASYTEDFDRARVITEIATQAEGAGSAVSSGIKFLKDIKNSKKLKNLMKLVKKMGTKEAKIGEVAKDIENAEKVINSSKKAAQKMGSTVGDEAKAVKNSDNLIKEGKIDVPEKVKGEKVNKGSVKEPEVSKPKEEHVKEKANEESKVEKETQKPSTKEKTSEKYNENNTEKEHKKINEETAETKEPANKENCGDPIDAATGSLYVPAVDMVLPDIHDEFRIERKYESINKDINVLGRGWKANFDSFLDIEDTRIKVLCTDGHVETFNLIDEEWVNDKGNSKSYTLNKNNNSWIFKSFKDRKTYYYDDIGRLKKVINKHGNKSIFTYNGTHIDTLTTFSNYKLSFKYKDGKVFEIEDDLGRTVKYKYDGDYLIEVVHTDNGVTKYEYDENGCIICITDQNGRSYDKNEYDKKGRVIKQDLIDEYCYITYDDSEREITFDYKNSNRIEKTRYNAQKLVTHRIYEDDTTEEYRYDEQQRRIYVKDRNGNETFRSFDEYGNLLKETKPNGLVTEYEYDQNQNLIKETDNLGKEKLYKYDSNNNLIEEKTKIATGEWKTESYKYDSCGRIIEKTDANNNTSKYSYDLSWYNNSDIPYEKRKKLKDPSAVVTNSGYTYYYEYDKVGRNTEIRTDYGTIEFGYNNLNYEAEIKDANGNITKKFYDKMGNLISLYTPNSCRKSGDYDHGYQYTYDHMDRLISIKNPLGTINKIIRDAQGNVIKEVNPNFYDRDAEDFGIGIQYEYDNDNRKIKTIYPDGGIERFFYDANGNVIKHISPEYYDVETDDGLGYSYTYDESNHLKSIINEDGITERTFEYDLHGNIVKQTDIEGNAVIYKYDLLGNVTEKRVPAARDENGSILYNVTLYSYDKNSNKILEKHGIDAVSENEICNRYNDIYFAYDTENRLIEVRDKYGAKTVYKYDCLNHKTYESFKINDKTNKIMHYKYDKAGNLVEKKEELSGDFISPEMRGKNSWAVTTYEYDKNGNVSKIITPNGHQITKVYDRIDRVIEQFEKDSLSGICRSHVYKYDKADNIVSLSDYSGREAELINKKYLTENDYRLTWTEIDENKKANEKRFAEENLDEDNKQKTYVYDEQNRLTHFTNVSGNTTRLFYDKNDRIIKQVLPEQYDVSKDDGEGTTYRYNVKGQVVEVKNALGEIVTRNTYDPKGNLQTSIDGENNKVEYTYTLLGQIKDITTPNSRKENKKAQSYSYDARGNITGIVDGNGNETSYLLDDWGRITQITTPEGGVEKYTYDYAGNITSTTDANGGTIKYFYNSLGQVSEIRDQEGYSEYFYYDNEGNLIKHIDRNNNHVDTKYNMDKNILSVEAYNLDEEAIAKDNEKTESQKPEGLSLPIDIPYYDLKINDENKEKKRKGRRNFRQEVLDKLTEKESASENHDVNANTDNKSGNVDYQGNENHNNDDFSSGNGVADNTDYLNNQSRINTKKPNIQIQQLKILAEHENKYDKYKLNVVSQRFKYNADGTLNNAYTGNMQYNYTYNADGYLESKSASGRTLLSYTYDKNNNLKTIKDITGKSSIYQYDKADRLQLITDDNGQTQAEYQYYSNNNLKSVTLGNGVKSDYTYDGDGNVASLVTVTSTGEVLVDYNYAYDLNGNRLQKVSSKHKNFYSYDSLNRLVDSSYDGRKESFTYDRVGNRLTKTTNDITEKYIYNVKNQLKELHHKDGINYFTFDKQGNTIKEETANGNNLFEYNTLNQTVKAVTKDGNTLISRYDTEGLRYEIEENEKLSRFIFNNQEVLVEIDKDDNAISRFIRGYDVVGADIYEDSDRDDNHNRNNRYYYSVDEQGSTSFITDITGKVKNEYYYDAFGNVLESKEEVHNRITYTGQQFDGITQQYYLRARFYNPIVGRFTQEDIYRGDGLNLYAYCGNNPVRYFDPSGYVCDEKYRAYAEIRKQHPDWTAKQAYNELKKIPPKQVNGGTFNVEVPPARRVGIGIVKDAHNANIRIVGSDGKTRKIWREVSGNATNAEKALGSGKMRQATHTEQRALTRINLNDETMIITGQNPPCNNCQGAMRRATMNNNATIRYQWRENGKTLYEVWKNGKKIVRRKK